MTKYYSIYLQTEKKVKTGMYLSQAKFTLTAIWKNKHAIVRKGDMGYDQYIVPDTVAVEATFIVFF